MLSKKTWRVRVVLYTLTGVFMMQPLQWNMTKRRVEQAPAWMQFLHYSLLAFVFGLRAGTMSIMAWNVATRHVPFPVVVASLVAIIPQLQSVLAQVTLFFLRDHFANLENAAHRFNKNMIKQYKVPSNTPDGLERMSVLAALTGLAFCCGSPIMALVICYVDESQDILHGVISTDSLEWNVLFSALIGLTFAVDTAQLFVWSGAIIHINAVRLWLERIKSKAAKTRARSQRLVQEYHIIQLLCHVAMNLGWAFHSCIVGSFILFLIVAAFSTIKFHTKVSPILLSLPVFAAYFITLGARLAAKFATDLTSTSVDLPRLLMSNRRFKRSALAKRMFRALKPIEFVVGPCTLGRETFLVGMNVIVVQCLVQLLLVSRSH